MVRTLRLFDTGGWVLPWRVADAEGYFAAEGLAAEFVRGESREDDRLLAGTKDLTASDKERAFVRDEIDVYSACEWGIIKRVVDLGAGKIIGNRRTVGMTHGIYVLPARGITSVADLRGVPIAINLNSGSYFAVVEGLEEVLKPEDVKTVHFGHPLKRYEALFTGKVEATALMEPFSALAEVRGAVKIAEYAGRGGWIGGDSLSETELAGFYRAVRRAVAKLNEEPEKYRDVLVDQLKDYDVAPELIEQVRAHIRIPRYLDPVPYERREFDATYDWMVDHEMIRPGIAFEEVVNPAAGH